MFRPIVEKSFQSYASENASGYLDIQEVKLRTSEDISDSVNFENLEHVSTNFDIKNYIF